MQQDKLITHLVSPRSLDNVIEQISHAIKQQGDKSYVSVEAQLTLLKELSEFEFGRYLLQNQGINGYWTDYMLYFPERGKKTQKSSDGQPLSVVEDLILTSPLLLATQQRAQFFLKENQKAVKNGAKLLSVPCGMMGELFYLNYDKINDISLIGLDYDTYTFRDAENLAKQKGLLKYTSFLQDDAWNIKQIEEYDLISCNGLTIYEADNNRVVELYTKFYQSLKSGGRLVTSFLTYPPSMTDNCEWNFTKIDKQKLLQQKIIMVDIIGGKWQCYRSSVEAHQQLKAAGFEDIKFIYDDANIFPVVVAKKK